MKKTLHCVHNIKPVVQRTYNFEENTYVWLLCETCKDRPAYQEWDSEVVCP